MVLLLAWLGLHTGKDATGTRLLATPITVPWGATCADETLEIYDMTKAGHFEDLTRDYLSPRDRRRDA